MSTNDTLSRCDVLLQGKQPSGGRRPLQSASGSGDIIMQTSDSILGLVDLVDQVRPPICCDQSWLNAWGPGCPGRPGRPGRSATRCANAALDLDPVAGSAGAWWLMRSRRQLCGTHCKGPCCKPSLVCHFLLGTASRPFLA